MSILSGLTFVVFPLAEFASGQIYKYSGYYGVYATSLAATIVGIVYIYFVPESVIKSSKLAEATQPSPESTNSGVVVAVVNFFKTGNKVLFEAMK